MIHKTIQIKNLSLIFPHKICFENFTATVHYGDHIAIIGRNGSGKSTLLKMLYGSFAPTSGSMEIPKDAVFGYVPQLIEGFDSLSAAQRLNKAITAAMCLNPNVLLLDEPTNYLDRHNRKSLLHMLKVYQGTLIVVSHDTELLRSLIDTLWSINNEKIDTFTGSYDNYITKVQTQAITIERELARLSQQKKEMHQALMKEQERIAKSKNAGLKKVKNRRWMKSTGDLKAMKAEKSQSGKLKDISQKRSELTIKLSELSLPEIIVPKFSLTPRNIGERIVLSISDGCIAYNQECPILSNINLSLNARNRIAITGDNGSGKSTLLKAILGNKTVIKQGNWLNPKQEDIGYLDQHYKSLSPEKTVFESTSETMPTCSQAEIRRHLNDFLFCKNEEVNTLTKHLSGGEKARLSLAVIAAKTPRLLMLDEITNNLDLETRQHVIEVLKHYPGAMIVVSHDVDFLAAIEIDTYYQITNNSLTILK